MNATPTRSAVFLAALYLLAVTALARGDRQGPDDALFDAVAHVESRGNAKAVNAAEDAVGIVQIRPIMVADVNRILRTQKYTLADRYDPAKSREMFDVFLNHYRVHLLRRHGKPESYENLARLWNGGPGNWQTADAGRYWQKVKGVMERTKRADKNADR